MPNKKNKKILNKYSIKKFKKKSIFPSEDRALSLYINEAFKYPVLSKEREEKLVEQMLNGDKLSTQELIKANLKLVVKIAFEYKKSFKNGVMDLIQEGTLGLIKASQKYDPAKGARFSYYASWWIRSFILKYILDNFRLVRIGTTQAQKRLFYNLINEQRKLENLGLKALPEKIGEKLKVKEKDVTEMMSRLDGGAEFSIDNTTENKDGETQSFLYYYPDTKNDPEILIESKSQKSALYHRLLELSLSLNDKEKEILKNRLLKNAPLTLQTIADKFNISKERVRQIEGRLLKKLKEELADFAGD